MATLSVPAAVPSPAEDADQLHKAFQGWGTDEKRIITVLAHRNAGQRRLIRQAYAEKYGEDLLKALDKELSSDFEVAVLLWTLDPAARDAVLANGSVRKWHPGNLILIEISCTRSPNELLLTRKEYHNRFKRSIEEDVAARTKGSFHKLLVPLVSVYRYDGPEVNMTLAKSESKLLHEKISDKAYDDDEVIRILTTRSKLQLAATFNQYINQFGKAITEDMEADSKDEFLTALKTVVTCLTSPEKYFEGVLRLAINKLGTDEEALTRVVTTRAEVDLQRIKEEYFKRNSVHLSRAIAGDTSGDYETMLLALVGQ